MGQTYDRITEPLHDFIRAQRIFFVATAPLDPHGHVNLSPKGLDTFRVLSERRVAYLDFTGSGNETAAHVHENGRLTLMFCALEGKPLILRLYGRGRAVLPGADGWADLIAHFPPNLPGVRQVVVAEIDRVQTSCGFGIPLYRFEADRDQLPEWAAGKGEPALAAYRAKHNARSIDGLPAPGERDASGFS